jgi:phage shock protein C
VAGELRGLIATLNGHDAYELLGVREDASTEDIKHAYRQRMKEWHSDRNSGPGAEEKTKLLNTAAAILRDHRAEYDRTRRPAQDESIPADPWDDVADSEEHWLDEALWMDATRGVVPPPRRQAATPQRPIRTFRRLRDSRMVAGVCSGLADYYNVDPVIVRLAMAVSTIFDLGSTLIFYCIAILMVPEEGKETSIAQELARKFSTPH